VSHTHWVGRGTGTPKDKDEVNRQEVCECEDKKFVSVINKQSFTTSSLRRANSF